MKTIKTAIIAILAMLTWGCEETHEPRTLEGDVVGFVLLTDEWGQDENDKSDVLISIEGLNRTAVTDANGRYAFTNIPAGTYNLLFSKTGYGTIKRFSQQLVGGNVPALLSSIKLFQHPQTEIETLNVSSENKLITIEGKNTKTTNLKVQAFINDSVNVSDLNFDYNTGITYTGYGWASFDVFIDLASSKYKTGETIYIVVYFSNAYEHACNYFNPELNQCEKTTMLQVSEVIPVILK
jgi:hypothetical protein